MRGVDAILDGDDWGLNSSNRVLVPITLYL